MSICDNFILDEQNKTKKNFSFCFVFFFFCKFNFDIKYTYILLTMVDQRAISLNLVESNFFLQKKIEKKYHPSINLFIHHDSIDVPNK